MYMFMCVCINPYMQVCTFYSDLHQRKSFPTSFKLLDACCSSQYVHLGENQAVVRNTACLPGFPRSSTPRALRTWLIDDFCSHASQTTGRRYWQAICVYGILEMCLTVGLLLGGKTGRRWRDHWFSFLFFFNSWLRLDSRVMFFTNSPDWVRHVCLPANPATSKVEDVSLPLHFLLSFIWLLSTIHILQIIIKRRKENKTAECRMFINMLYKCLFLTAAARLEDAWVAAADFSSCYSS